MSTPYGTVIESGNSGALRITYGRNGLAREIICDARSCRLYLGECDAVVVEAWRWTDDNSLTQIPTVNIAADICVAGGGEYDEATVTYLHTIESLIDFDITLPVPRHARWYTPIVQWDDTSLWGTEFPDINFFGTAIAPFTFSPSNYLWIPSAPRLEVFQSPLRIKSSDTITQSPITVGARFWIST